jgi:polygalacturonase
MHMDKICICGFLALTLAAQDLRTVSEPRIPSTKCAILKARLSATGGVLADESVLDTARVEQAIDACASGQAVELANDGARNIFLIGPITLKAGVTLVVDSGVAVFASRNPRDYDVDAGSCGVVNEKGHGCKPLILADHAPGSGIMGDGSIDGRGGAKLIGQNATWWDLAHTAKVTDQQQSCPRLVIARQSDGFTLYNLTLRNSPNFHVSVERTDGFTAWGVKIRTPKTARNTDGIDPSSSTNVTIAHCSIATGDDNVAIKAGSSGPASHMSIEHNHFYSGHGMSIGSETNGGANAIRVSDLTIDGADNGIRIKSDRSRGGLVRDIMYENVCMRDVKNPIFLTTTYTLHAGDKIPVYRDIVLQNVTSVTPGRVTVTGLDEAHKIQVFFRNVFVEGELKQEHADISGRFAIDGQLPPHCEFPPLPENSSAPSAAVTIPPDDHAFYVAADGTGDYSSIQSAIDAAPESGALISVAPGTYREVLTITKPKIVISGAGPAKVVIVNNKSAGDSGGTFKSATVNVRADDFHALGLTIANDFNATHPQLSQGSQAIALSVTGDRAVFNAVSIRGNQDTLYLGTKDCSPGAGEHCTAARQYFENCYIEGNVDFIFGDGKAYFENCEIHSTAHKGGFVTAQGKHYADQDSGFVFDHCKLTAEPGVTGVWLGRPWRPYATVIFLNSEMGPHIDPAGWREWHPGETHYLDTVFYAEYASSSKGRRDPHTHLLDRTDGFERTRFLNGWDPTKATNAHE